MKRFIIYLTGTETPLVMLMLIKIINCMSKKIGCSGGEKKHG
jgi:hypothetical protein